MIGAAILSLVGLTGAFAISRGLGWAGIAYLGLLVAYSFWLKHLVILDVLAIAGGFVLRAVAGRRGGRRFRSARGCSSA